MSTKNLVINFQASAYVTQSIELDKPMSTEDFMEAIDSGEILTTLSHGKESPSDVFRFVDGEVTRIGEVVEQSVEDGDYEDFLLVEEDDVEDTDVEEDNIED